MEDLTQINYVVFGENILPEIFKETMDTSYNLDINCSMNNKQNFKVTLYYMSLSSKDHTNTVVLLNTFDYNLAIFVVDLLDGESLDKLKNFKFKIKEDAAEQFSDLKEKFADLKDYISKKKLFPVVIGYVKDYSKKVQLKEEDVMSFARELKRSSQFRDNMNESYLYEDDPYVAILEITKVYLSVKFKMNFSVINTPKEDIKFTFLTDETKKNKKHYCRPY